MRICLIYLFIVLINLSSLYAQKYQYLWDLYFNNQHEKAISLAKELLEENEFDSELNLLAGRSLCNLHLYEEAIPYLYKVISNIDVEPHIRAWAYNYAGKAYFATGEYNKSKYFLKEVIKSKATKNVVKSSRKWLKIFGFDTVYQQWKTIPTQHFNFHFQNNSKVKLIDNYVSDHEKGFKTINNFFKSDLPKKIDLFIWNYSSDAEHSGIGKLGYAVSEYCLCHKVYNQTVGHEISHIIANYFDNIEYKTGLINEGTAVFFDLTSENKLLLAKQRINENKLKSLSIKSLWSNWKSVKPEISYPISGAFIKFLIDSEGKEKFLNLYKNQSYENAKTIYGEKLNIIISEFEFLINKN